MQEVDRGEGEAPEAPVSEYQSVLSNNRFSAWMKVCPSLLSVIRPLSNLSPFTML